MEHTTIFVRLLGEAVDCWRPVQAVEEASGNFRIVGPQADPEEEWEFQTGELVRCRVRDGDMIAVELAALDADRPSPGSSSSQSGANSARRRALAEAVAQAIDDADPIGLLARGAPRDEYAPEIASILSRLPSADAPQDVLNILHHEFSRWFGAGTAGPRQAYEAVALRVWSAVLAYRYAG